MGRVAFRAPYFSLLVNASSYSTILPQKRLEKMSCEKVTSQHLFPQSDWYQICLALEYVGVIWDMISSCSMGNARLFAFRAIAHAYR